MPSSRPRLLPERADNDFRGRKVALVVFYVITFATLVRSLIHLLAPDGGAQSIATIPLDAFGADAAGAVVFTFSVWGLSQVLLGVVYVVVALRYRSLIPLMYTLLIVEYAGRLLVGRFKPVVTVTTPPGEIVNYVMVPLGIMMLVLSLWPRTSTHDQ